MFEEIAGLPVHPLVVHAAVVFVPLLALAALVYALVPRLRSPLRWVTTLLAVLAPITALVAVLAGDAFQQARGLPLEGALADHRGFGIATLLWTLGLAVAALLLIGLHRWGGRGGAAVWTSRVVTVALVVAAVASLWYVVQAGDSGARMIWENVL